MFTAHMTTHDEQQHNNIDGLVLDCSNSGVLAMELLQYCTN